MKRLLVTSDDFGMCHAVNAGIVRAMTEGIVRSTNLLAPCPWFSEAAELCKAHSLPAGVHLCITSEWDRLRWGPLTPAPSLRAPDGCFPSNQEDHAGKATDEDIRAELEAQLARVRSHGIEPTHLDTHMLPSVGTSPHAERVRGIVRELSQEHGLPYTYERITSGEHAGRLRHFDGEIEISSLSDDAVKRTVESWTAPGTYHLIGHAAEPSEELRSVCSPNYAARAWAEPFRARDLAFFTSDATRRWLEALGFELVPARSALT